MLIKIVGGDPRPQNFSSMTEGVPSQNLNQHSIVHDTYTILKKEFKKELKRDKGSCVFFQRIKGMVFSSMLIKNKEEKCFC